MSASTSTDLIVDEWLKSLYANDVTLTGVINGRVYQEVPPENAVYPCIVHRLYVPRSVLTATGNLVANVNDIIICGICATPYFRDLETIAARIQALTHRPAATTVTRGTILGAIRLQLHRQAYSEGDVSYRELGGVYRIWSSV